jgi:hypothetical protein
MMNLVASLLSALIISGSATGSASVVATAPTTPVLAQHEMSLANRYAVASVNEVMKKNILLNLSYLAKSVQSKSEVDWEKVGEPFAYTLALAPGKTFAYHDDVLPEFQANLQQTTNAHFSSDEGFVTDGYLFGDGVCHLASLINWVAQDAGLAVLVTKNHNFANIPEVPKEYGVSIYTIKGQVGSGARNNLYITNNHDHAIQFHFVYTADEKLTITATE